MKKVFITMSFLVILLDSCRKKCTDYPSYSLCPEQLEWFRPEGEIWHFLLNDQDTVLSKSGSVKRDFYHTKRKPLMSRECSQYGPKEETGAQEIEFLSPKFSEKMIIVAKSNTDTYTCFSVKYSMNAKEIQVLDSVSINKKMYYKVTRAYRDFYIGQNYFPDTLYYSKDKGLLKVSYVEKNIKLERF